ncbi:MAG TPA: hypothetical protein VFA59_23025 [Vicinamibacterales bacterium]|nr:hypothetical protein [Vicinamibacterales bacterium]
MPWLLTLIWAFASQVGFAFPINVTTIRVGAPTVLAQLDIGQLKGELRQIGWSTDGAQLYVQTADGEPPRETLRHFVVSVGSGVVTPTDQEPAWAQEYWARKSDRTAPGAPMLEIDVKQTFETKKIGTGTAGAIDGIERAGGNTIMSGNNLDRENQKQKLTVWRFSLFETTIGEFVNTRPIPGLTFSWGPRGTGAMAFTTDEGRLMFIDQEQHKQSVAGVKDAILPAWSLDGERLAYAVKTGRKKYKLVWCTITK